MKTSTLTGILAPLIVLTTVGVGVALPSASAATTTDETYPGEPYPGDPAAESLLIAAETSRLIDVREVSNAASWTDVSQNAPFRLVTGNTFTLVLVGRAKPYTIEELISIAPRTLVRLEDGTYQLNEHIVVEEGATLELGSGDGFVLHMLSNPDKFVSIVTMGGSLVVAGGTNDPASITAWDTSVGAIDDNTADGRSYIRVIGGHADISFASFDHLGFWSGMTGGLSLTGTELPEVPVEEATEENPTIYGNEILPVGEDAIQTLELDPDLSGYSAVSASITNSTFSQNAFGLFVTSADGLFISETTVEQSLVDGIVLHRDVTNSVIRDTVSSENAVDGFSVTRASTAVVLDNVTANGNGRNGITIQGSALAEGPSATGASISSYGNNKVIDSSAANNARYGIEVTGGTNILVDDNEVTGNHMGIVVSDGAELVTVTENTVQDSVVQGIALRDAGLDAVVSENTVRGADIGIYVRDAGGTFTHNVIEAVTNHAITLVGATGNSIITDNSVTGSGPSAIDVARTDGSVVDRNDTEAWISTKPIDVVLRSIFQPLTVLWLSLGLVLLVTAFSGIGRRNRGFRNPYAERAPLSSFTKGVVSPEEARAARARALGMPTWSGGSA